MRYQFRTRACGRIGLTLQLRCSLPYAVLVFCAILSSDRNVSATTKVFGQHHTDIHLIDRIIASADYGSLDSQACFIWEWCAIQLEGDGIVATCWTTNNVEESNTRFGVKFQFPFEIALDSEQSLFVSNFLQETDYFESGCWIRVNQAGSRYR